MTTNGLSKLEQKIKERQEREAAAAAQAPVSATSAAPSGATSKYDADIPEVELNIDPEQQALDDAILQLGIVEAYNTWCKKMVPNPGSRQKEGIKCSCPNPAHPDKNPSAWLNTEKNVYFCSGCNYGGDIWDIAAFHFGYSVPGYKQDPVLFRELREKIGADLGFQLIKGMNKTYLVAPGNQEDDDPTAAPVGLTPQGAEAVSAEEESAEQEANAPEIDWRTIVQKDSFLYEWMVETTQDTCPEEYHFWNGLLALGFAGGRIVTLDDSEQVVGNLFICLTGPSGAGKSRSTRHLSRLMRNVMPYNYDDPFSRGVKHIRSPGSAEYLVHEFQSVTDDPSNPKKKLYWPVRGLVEFGELSTFMGTANRMGNNLKPQLMEIYDAGEEVSSGSLGGGLRRADYPFGSVISTTQHRSLRKLLSDGDDGSGFINRWIFAQGKLKQRLSRGGVTIDVTTPGIKLKHIHQWATLPKQIEWSQDASDLWESFFRSTVDPTQSKADESGTAVLGRIDLLMKKLFLLFAINRMEDVLSKESVQQGIDMWHYLLATYGVVNVEMRKNQNTDLREEVLLQIERLSKANGKEPSRREIYSAVKRKVDGDKQLIDIIDNLIKLDLIHEIQPTKGVRGRPTTRYGISA